MAKVTITLEDSSDGDINVQMSFDPKLEHPYEDLTTAQIVAVNLLDTLKKEYDE